MRFATIVLALSLALTACKKKTDTGGATTGSAGMTTGSAGSAMMGSDMGSAGAAMGSAGMGSDMGSAAAMGSGMGSDMGSGAGSDADTAMAHHAGMCPSTVFGSTTKADVKGKTVVVTVTATDKDAIKAVQTRAASLVAAKKTAKQSAEHDQKSSHGGGTGLCPVYVPEGATATAKNEKSGVAVTITPKDKPDELKTEIDGRITKAADYVEKNVKPGDKGTGGGVGGGAGKDGMNHSGQGDAKGMERKKGSGGGAGTGGGGGMGTGGGGGSGKTK